MQPETGRYLRRLWQTNEWMDKCGWMWQQRRVMSSPVPQQQVKPFYVVVFALQYLKLAVQVMAVTKHKWRFLSDCIVWLFLSRHSFHLRWMGLREGGRAGLWNPAVGGCHLRCHHHQDQSRWKFITQCNHPPIIYIYIYPLHHPSIHPSHNTSSIFSLRFFFWTSWWWILLHKIIVNNIKWQIDKSNKVQALTYPVQ